MAQHTTYFSDWRNSNHACDCGWTGPASGLTKDYFAELVAYACPSCERNLVLVSFPNADEIKSAAAAGNQEAISMLSSIKKDTR